eukprot:gene17660-biopygen3876
MSVRTVLSMPHGAARAARNDVKRRGTARKRHGAARCRTVRHGAHGTARNGAVRRGAARCGAEQRGAARSGAECARNGAVWRRVHFGQPTP